MVIVSPQFLGLFSVQMAIRGLQRGVILTTFGPQNHEKGMF